MTIEEKLQRLTGMVESVAASAASRKDRIQASLKAVESQDISTADDDPRRL